MITDETSKYPASDEYHRYVRNKLLYKIRDKLSDEGWKADKFDAEKFTNVFYISKDTHCHVVVTHVLAEKYCYISFHFRNHPNNLEIGWKTFMKSSTAEILTEFLL